MKRKPVSHHIKTILMSSILMMSSLSHGASLQLNSNSENNDQKKIWPTKEWPTKPLKESGFNQEKFNKFLDYVWEDEGNFNSDSIVIIKDGNLVYEGYSNGYTKNKKHMLWSLTKSMTSIIMGSALKNKILDMNDPIHKYFPTLNRKDAEDIKLHHVLNMSSGFDFFEEHPIHDIFSDSVSVYYSRHAYKNVALGVSKLPMKHKPGTQFKYGTHEPMLAMGILKKAINNQEVYDNYPWTAVFNKLGMKNVTFEQDLSGTFMGGAYAHASARDYAKLGYLLLNKGKWDGEEILTEEYVDFAIKKVAPALYIPKKEKKQQRLNVETYGAYFWLNGILPMNENGRPYPAAPEELVQAMGFRGQTMGLIPSKNLIIVRLGSDGVYKKIKRNKMYQLLLASLEE